MSDPTAGIDLISGQAVPNLALIPGSVGPVAVCNLTNNFDPNPTKVGWAFTLVGHVKAPSAPPGQTFGFVQYMKHNFLGIFYAGRTRNEGSIGMLLHPLITNNFLLDCAPVTTRPFIVPPGPNSVFAGGEQTANMGDHPVLAVKQRQQNVTTGVENFLFHIVDDREVWSIFTVQRPNGTFQHLAHVSWTLRYEFKLKWRAGSATVENKSKFVMGTPARGTPSDASLATALSGLSATQTPIANEQARSALRTVLVPPNPNRSDNSGWFNNVGPDFFA